MVRETHCRRCWLLLIILVLGWKYCDGQSVCEPNPCLNNGACQVAAESQSVSCRCLNGFTGSLCETEVTPVPCPADYCYHGGTCLTENGVNKCMCTDHYLGNRCEGIRRHCAADNPCQNKALCEDIHDGGYTCFCLPGYSSTNCDLDINECQSSPCDNGGSCVDLVNSYKCDCPIGTTGLHCEQVVTEGCSGSPCLHGATCQDVAGDNRFTCTCVTGYMGVRCETNIDDCQTAACEEYQVCTDLINGFRCDCPPGRSGDQCEDWDDLCASMPCQNAGVCVHEGDRYSCECQQGYAGIHCEIQTDPCYPDPCLHSSICQTNYTSPSKYTCKCADGFMGDNCEAKISSCLSFPCQHGGTCLENISTAGFTCQCPGNYTGAMCESRTDGCLLTGCEKGGTCIPSAEGNVCNCMLGWTGDRCQDDLDECVVSLPCQNGGQCVNVPGAYLCICDTYWTGKDCELDEIECGSVSSPCQNNGTCLEQLGAPPNCQCIPGTSGQYCETLLDGCEPNPCVNNAPCTNTHGNFTCTCSLGYTGQTCDTEINECDLYTPCLNNATCTDLLDSYICTCAPGFTGVNCSLNIDDCDLDLCHNGGTCQDGVNGYKCLCKLGFTGANCETDINECDSKLCQNNATCVDLVHSFTCQCQLGFTGQYCEVNMDDCEPDPCHHGSQCVDGVADYTCICTPGYGGKNCSDDVQECQSSPCLHGGTCTEPSVGSYGCQCPPGIHGNNCQEVTMATFDGQSSISLPPLTETVSRRKRSATIQLDDIQSFVDNSQQRSKRQVSTVTLNFWFSTSILEGLLLLARGNMPSGDFTHFAVFLKDGQLHVSQNLFGETITGHLDLSPSNQVISHHVTVAISTTTTSISLDNCIVGEKCHMTLTESLIGQELYLNEPMAVGGTRYVDPYLNSKLPTTGHYTGCFGNLTINNEPVNLFPEFGTAAYNQSTHLPLAGCRSHDSCQPDFCTATGKCMDRWVDKYCSCIDGFIGSKCGTQNTVHFLSESFLHLKNYSKITSLSFRISANSTNGMILYTLDLDMMALYIADSQLVLHLVVNGDDFVSRVGNLDNGDWYHVAVEFGQGIYRLHLTHETEGVAGSATGTVGNYLDVYTPLFMGQLHEHPAVNKWRNRSDIPIYKSFTGCIQNLTINDAHLDFQSATPSVFGNDPRAPYPGCPRDQICSTSPCGSQGSCNGGWGKSVCDCGDSLEGNFCETKVPMSFSGDGSHALLHVNTTVVPFGDSGSFGFRTRDQTATLLFIQFYSILSLSREPTTSLEFGLYKGNVQVTVTTDKVTMVTFDADAADAEWHVVTWSRGQNLIKVTQDSRSLSLQVKVNPYNENSQVDVFVGGKPFKHGDPSYIIGSLRGCINDLKFNNQNVLYFDDTQDGVSLHRKKVEPGCLGDDFCVLEPCPGNSVCEKLWNARDCTCMPGWEGDSCETSIDDCVSNACIHGECVDGHLNYTCNCTYGYIGELCDKMYNPCESNPCYTEGTANCTFIFPAQFECVCTPGWVGQDCSVNINECESSPCLNNGQCRDMVNGFECDCPGYYFGTRCEQLNICSSQPCFNGGLCQSSSNNTKFSCDCLPRYTGSQCQTYNFCYDSLCENNATCSYDLHGYTCGCMDGFYGVHCQFQDYCASEPCLNDAECFNDKESFRCLCSEFYSGTVCDKPVNRCNTQVCLNGATCFFNASNPESGYECMCMEGFTGLHCETDIDECLSTPCLHGGTCHDSNEQSWKFFPGYICDCVDGYYGDQCQNETDECASSPCTNNGMCIDLINSYRCDCREGYSGYKCELDVRGCMSSPCNNDGVCRETTGSDYVCECATGFTGQLCETNINDCAVNDCLNGATCIDGINEYNCQCFHGYSGSYCEHVVDACYSQPCLNNGACLYRGMCDCENIVLTCGWHNESCQVERCDKSSQCNTYTIPYTCDCDSTGYIGDVCEKDVDECLEPSQCEHGGICTNTVGSFTCDCSATGYKGNRCEIDIDECSGPNPCFNGGACENFLGSYKCLCPAGWTGQTCGQLFDHCEDQPCRNHGNCINTISGFLCDCTTTGFQGDTCEININDCAGNPCRNNGRCLDGINNYTCDCTGTGYHGDNCETETDHCEGSPCQHNGTCTDVGLTFRCDCSNTGYAGKSCDLDIDECVMEEHECIEGATCLNTQGSYRCLCTEYFSGQFCELDLRQTSQTSSEENNIGVVIASVLIILAIVIAALIYAYWYLRKSRRLKGRYKPSHMEQSGPGVAPGIPLDKILDSTNGERLI